MAKKKAARGNASSTDPKQLRKRLRKTEAGLAKAEAKRDKVQARVEALAIMADEIRAQLAESEQAAAKDKAAEAKRRGTAKRTGRSRATAGTSKQATGKGPAPSKASTTATST